MAALVGRGLSAVRRCTSARFFSTSGAALAGVDIRDEHVFTQEHYDMRQTLGKLIEKDINPYVEEWEKARTFPAHSLIKKLGENGLLGPTRPEEYGGLGLDYSYSMAIAEELGTIKCGGVPMGIGVHTGKYANPVSLREQYLHSYHVYLPVYLDMATPALTRFGSEDLKQKYLAPSIAGDILACLGVSEVSGGSDVASIKTTAVPKRGQSACMC